ncbi:MAG: hypothetical protein PHW69_03265 [Elusimicrobiaceae bacterium]|nr:hypothetical protein [Elusimicrobiaceae bacterium]
MRNTALKFLAVLLAGTGLLCGSAAQAAGTNSEPPVLPPAQAQPAEPPAISSAVPPVGEKTAPRPDAPDQTAPATASAARKTAAYDYDNPAVPLSGIVLMPTSYRGRGLNTIGLSLDINAAYYIGRLYGKNSFDWTLNKKNYLDRIGQWMLAVDGKMMVQTEGDWRPAVAAGVLGMFTFRDSGSSKLDDPTVNVSVKSSQGVGSAYVNASKRFFSHRLLATAGYMQGTFANVFPLLSEFLTDESISLSGHPGQTATSPNIMYGGMLFMITPKYPIGFEVLIPQGAALNPKLVNFHLGSLLKLNFEVSYLAFDGGWDALGMIQFRYTFFPK